MSRPLRITIKSVVIFLLASCFAGVGMGTMYLHPFKKPMTAATLEQVADDFARIGATREEMEVRAADGAVLRGWKVRPKTPNGDWVLLYHGVGDGRIGMLPYAEMLSRNGYGVVMMDERAQGASGGEQATYGWKEREDSRRIAAALVSTEDVHCLFALGESLGAAIALQSAAAEPRIAGVVAESPFRNLREVSYDYVALKSSPWLGKTLLRPVSIVALLTAEMESGLPVDEISPENAVEGRPFPVLLICGREDRSIPLRHSKAVYSAASGPKELWVVPRAGHSGAFGTAPEEFERRVISFFRAIHVKNNLAGALASLRAVGSAAGETP
jgi:alpha-beta hydrolase superfamily lysophospholipase